MIIRIALVDFRIIFRADQVNFQLPCDGTSAAADDECPAIELQ